MSSAGTLMTPRTDSKIRSAMYKRRKSNFKDIVRERFRDTVRRNRHMLFGKMRSSDDSKGVRCALSDYILRELEEMDKADLKRRVRNQSSSQSELEEPELDHDVLLELKKEIEVELVNEQYEWIQEQCRIEEEQIVTYESESVACPLCHRGILGIVRQFQPNRFDLIACTGCDLRLAPSMSLENVNGWLNQNVEEHTRSCSGVPQFGILNYGAGNTLLMTCDQCLCLSSLN